MSRHSGLPVISVTTPELENEAPISPKIPVTPVSPQAEETVPMNSNDAREGDEEEAVPKPRKGLLTQLEETNALKDSIVGQGSPVQAFYQGKSILVTGVTGFIGKAVLWKCITSIGRQVDTIYVLIRNGGATRRGVATAKERLASEFYSNLIFTSLPSDLQQLAHEKIRPIPYDLSAPDLAISPIHREEMIEKVNVVIHCAAATTITERLDLAFEANTLGTVRMMDLADTFNSVDAFVYLSSTYLSSSIEDGVFQEKVYPMPTGDADVMFQRILRAGVSELSALTQEVLAQYPTTYAFTKHLTEHIILRRCDLNRLEEANGGKEQYPIAIVRAAMVGSAVEEPLRGWVHNICNSNGLLYFTGKGFPCLDASTKNEPADIVPVDHLVRLLLGSAAMLQKPGVHFSLPWVNDRQSRASSPQTTSSRRNSLSQEKFFPAILQLSAQASSAPSWQTVYSCTRSYWMRKTMINLPREEEVFPVSPSVFPSRIFSRYKLSSFANVAQSLVTGLGDTNVQASKPNKYRDMSARLAAAIAPFLRKRWSPVDDAVQLILARLSADASFRVDNLTESDWYSYYLDYNYGLHRFIDEEANIRCLGLTKSRDCALYPVTFDDKPKKLILSRQVSSDVASQDDIRKREERMISYFIAALGKRGGKGNTEAEVKEDERWMQDLEYVLEDWYHDEELQQAWARQTEAKLGKWKLNKQESIKLREKVLNSPAVLKCLEQIQQSSGVSQQRALQESQQFYDRVRDRTALPYIYFAARFLDQVFKTLFETIQVKVAEIETLKRTTRDAPIIYVPVSKSLLDSFIVWFQHIPPDITHDFIARAKWQNDDTDAPAPKFVPINIIYDKIPELSQFTDDILDQTTQTHADSLNVPLTGVSRPSEEKAARNRADAKTDGSFGRVTVRFGEAQSSDSPAVFSNLDDNTEESLMIWRATREEQRRLAVLTAPVVVAATILWGRTRGGVHLDCVIHLLQYVRQLVLMRNIEVDWEDHEDIRGLVYYSLRVLDSRRNLVVDQKHGAGNIRLRVSEHSDNIMALVYYANQLTDFVLLDSLFATLYVALPPAREISLETLEKRFGIIKALTATEVTASHVEHVTLSGLLAQYSAATLIAECAIEDSTHYTIQDQPDVVEPSFMASLVQPILDCLWVTTCSLSVLAVVPFIPQKIVPPLVQWIAAHLISGRRTPFREVLSIESSRNALVMLLKRGILREISDPARVSPTVRVALHELGVSLNDPLIEVADSNGDDSSTLQPAKVFDLCQEIDEFRYSGGLTRVEVGHIFTKCRQQINAMINSNVDKAKKQVGDVVEVPVVALVRTLRESTASNFGVNTKHVRRVSEVFNLSPSTE
ncbi:hypothetical protein BZG36_04432 [Bifiguratus adelaidae]|uniref:Fatty acyl-CoA reductase n=1 Tax=Bifiguratus adelaidae TaxID=1938954 RepID=A0A261XVG9_9FUNG|nr:hypothetical protein BZG36_04432 [Bifiguratus adelaidae]